MPLFYNEPAAWHIPVRQNLGAVLIKAGKFREAEIVYREDLRKLRKNGWSLMGLYKSLVAQDKLLEAKKIKQEFETAWQDSDIKLESSIM
jgi:Tfp pilus assembly protein PilF